jgi:hypothetical protein
VKRLYTYYVPYDAFHGKLAEQGVDRVEQFMQTFIGWKYYRNYTRKIIGVDTDREHDGAMARLSHLSFSDSVVSKWLPLFLVRIGRCICDM